MVKKGTGLPGEEKEEEFEYEVDCTGVENDFPIISMGKHGLVLKDFEKGESKAGKPMFIWDFVVIDGEDAGKKIRHWTSLVPEARWKVVEILVALGVAAEGKVAKFKGADVLGKVCYGMINHDESLTSTHFIDTLIVADKELLQIAKDSKEIPF